MKTDNSNIVVESLQDAAWDHACEFLPEQSTIRLSSFQHGANWQKEQCKAILESHSNLRKGLNKLLLSHYRAHWRYYPYRNRKVH